MPENDLTDVEIAVLGAGLIGAAWAALFQHHGAQVTVWDPDKTALDDLEARMQAPLAQLGEITQKPAKGRLTITDDLAQAAAHADLIQENAPEDVPTKQALYAQIETAAPKGAIIASSTSALTWSDLSPGLRLPARFITAHPFNPPHLIPLVEVYGIDETIVTRAMQIYAAAGRVPVRLQQDATGHIANRLASALWREAVHIVDSGIADVAAVDAALVHGPGLRWSVLGAHMAYHLGGGAQGMAGYLDHLGPSQERRWKDLGTPTLSTQTCAKLVEGVTAAAEGRDIPKLEAARDADLIRLLKAREG